MFDAWSDEPWVLDGAAVRVSLVCFRRKSTATAEDLRLDGVRVARISTDLSSDDTDTTRALPLAENGSTAFEGTKKYGDFDIEGAIARKWLTVPQNPNGRSNVEVIKPWLNADGLTDRNPDKWIIDFGCQSSENEAALFEAPYEYALEKVKPYRSTTSGQAKQYWWRHERCRPKLRQAIRGLKRFVATPRVATHRLYVWLPAIVLPDTRLVVIAKDDASTFGILHSRFHERWSVRQGGWHGKGNDPQYTPTTGFETFPFPEGLTPNIPAKDYAKDPRAVAIAKAANRLNELREAWLNPPDLIKRVPEVVPGYPDRILPKSDAAAAELKKRTLTDLYNQRPAWLDNAHRELDAAVAAAYGWPADISDEDALARLFALNQERAKKQGEAKTKAGKPEKTAKPRKVSKSKRSKPEKLPA